MQYHKLFRKKARELPTGYQHDMRTVHRNRVVSQVSRTGEQVSLKYRSGPSARVDGDDEVYVSSNEHIHYVMLREVPAPGLRAVEVDPIVYGTDLMIIKDRPEFEEGMVGHLDAFEGTWVFVRAIRFGDWPEGVELTVRNFDTGVEVFVGERSHAFLYVCGKFEVGEGEFDLELGTYLSRDEFQEELLKEAHRERH
jgi:hypothetical protein